MYVVLHFISYTYHTSSLTQATDTSNIRLVFAAVKETILNNALKDSGIL
jgi:guanine nucleotide-binding protein G(i) subunit alpha